MAYMVFENSCGMVKEYSGKSDGKALRSKIALRHSCIERKLYEGMFEVFMNEIEGKT